MRERDFRGQRASLFDSLEAGNRAASSEQDNEHDLDGLHERASILKRLTTDIHEEVESHSRLLDQMGSSMDSARSLMSASMDRFKKVFEKKSSRNMFTVVISFVLLFMLVYFLAR